MTPRDLFGSILIFLGIMIWITSYPNVVGLFIGTVLTIMGTVILFSYPENPYDENR